VIVSRPHRKSGFNDERLWQLVLLGLLVGSSSNASGDSGQNVAGGTLAGDVAAHSKAGAETMIGRVSARLVSRPWSEISGSPIT
jgi:hypothetical protein